MKNETYYSDYDNEPIGGSNPYYRCAYCKVSDPEINGRLDGHSEWCEYRIEKEKELKGYKMEAREFLIGEISKYNPSVPKKQVEKVVNKYTEEDIERLADAMIRFGTDAIFKAILKN